MNRHAKFRALVALADEGNFSRAARRLGLSQPALSRSIQALEAGLGAQLVDRRPRGIRLTPLGEEVVTRARGLLEGVSELELELRQFATLAAGSVRLGAGPYQTALLVPHLLAAMAARYPGLELAYEAGGLQLIIQRLKEKQLDVVIADGVDAEKDQDLQVTWLVDRPIRAVARRHHPLAGGSGLAFPELAGYPLAAASLPTWISDQLARALGRPWEPGFLCDDVAVQVAFVKGSDAVMLMPAGLEQRFPGLARLDLSAGEPPLRFRWAIIRLARRTLPPGAQRLLELTREFDRRIPEPAAPD